jgi:hypothetical protein
LDDLGFQSERNISDIEKEMLQDITSFRKQVRSEFEVCSSTTIDFYSRLRKFRLGRFEFKLTGVCYNRVLYVFRQPCDFNHSASTTALHGKPESKILVGGRKVILEPYETFQ